MRRVIASAVLLMVAVCYGLAAEEAKKPVPLVPENAREIEIKYNLIMIALKMASREIEGVRSTATEKMVPGIQACAVALAQLQGKVLFDGRNEMAAFQKALKDQEDKAKKEKEAKAKASAKADASVQGPPVALPAPK